MAYFNTCEYCAAALDPGEKCDCRKARVDRREHEQANKRIRKIKRSANRPSAEVLPINIQTA